MATVLIEYMFAFVFMRVVRYEYIFVVKHRQYSIVIVGGARQNELPSGKWEANSLKAIENRSWLSSLMLDVNYKPS